MNLESNTAGNIHLTYLAPGDVLKGRVEPTIWMRMCDSFAKTGMNVALVTVYAYRKENVRRGEIFEHYGLDDHNFKLTILPTPFNAEPHLLWYRSWTAATNFVYGVYLALFLKFAKFKHLIFYSRSPIAMLPYLYLKRLFKHSGKVSFFLETHALPTSPGAVRVFKEVDGVIVSSRKLAADMENVLGISRDRLHVAYLAANALPSTITYEEARKELGLDPERRFILYTGKLLMPEVCLMLDAAEVLARTVPAAQMVFVGGNAKILAECKAEITRRNLQNVSFTGFVAPARVALYQKAADALMLYLVSDRNIINYITPSKVFDYLQAGRPIIASDYPILHEILEHNRNAVFVRPHEPAELASELKRVLETPELADGLSKCAEVDSRQYSWRERVGSICKFMQRIHGEKHASTS